MPFGTVWSAAVLVFMLPAAGQSPDTRPLEQKMAERVNVEREVRGLEPLELNPVLSETARRHSQRMLDRGEVSHEVDGSTMQERIQNVVPNACRFGENITKHYTIEYALSDLMGSEGHRSNLLNPEFAGIGIGIVRGKDGLLYITQDFFSLCVKPPRER